MTNSPYLVRRRLPEVEAMQWTGENTEALIKWAQGGWKPRGIWLQQRCVEEQSGPAWFLVLLSGDEIAVGGWLIKSQDDRLSALSGNLWDGYDPMETRHVA